MASHDGLARRVARSEPIRSGRSGLSAARRSARSSASPTGSSTTGPGLGLLRPSITDARGSGTQRCYSYHDVLDLKVIKQLLDAGVSLRQARRAVECLREDLGADLATANLVLAGRTRCSPTRRARWWTCSAEARGCSTSFRCAASSRSSKRTSSGSDGAGRSRPPPRHRPEQTAQGA